LALVENEAVMVLPTTPRQVEIPFLLILLQFLVKVVIQEDTMCALMMMDL
jgi:hypothetical protein